jgi:cysteine synthase
MPGWSCLACFLAGVDMKFVSKVKPERRAVVAGVGAVGALAGVAAVLPGAARTADPAVAAAAPAADTKGGYQLTDHVRRYYQTARV